MSSPIKKSLEASDLARISDRLSFVYLERCTVHRDDHAITAQDREGTLHIPVATLGCLMLGPGTRVTSAAMALLGDTGVSVVWTGENGVRFYAHGRSLARSSRLLEKQARLVSNNRSRLAVARKMYEMRFPGEDVSRLTMQQLRGREGARVRAAYRREAARTGVPWDKRDYDPDDFDASDDINKALTAANAAMYGIVHSVIVALGCSPGLGFIHSGNDRSLVYDIADLYKAELTIPVAFDAVGCDAIDLTGSVRRTMRDAVVNYKLLERCSRDIVYLLGHDADDLEWLQDDEVSLWTGRGTAEVASGQNYEDRP